MLDFSIRTDHPGSFSHYAISLRGHKVCDYRLLTSILVNQHIFLTVEFGTPIFSPFCLMSQKSRSGTWMAMRSIQRYINPRQVHNAAYSSRLFMQDVDTVKYNSQQKIGIPTPIRIIPAGSAIEQATVP